MEIREYQEYVKQGASDRYKDLKFAGLALVGEVGEVCDVIKKASIYTDNLQHLDYKVKLLDELGDVLWQYTALVNSVGLDIENIINFNVEKLNQRHGSAKLDKTGGKR